MIHWINIQLNTCCTVHQEQVISWLTVGDAGRFCLFTVHPLHLLYYELAVPWRYGRRVAALLWLLPIGCTLHAFCSMNGLLH
jgi:hypothetical protein